MHPSYRLRAFRAFFLMVLLCPATALGQYPTSGSPDPGCHYVDSKHYHFDFTATASGLRPLNLNNSGFSVGEANSYGITAAYFLAGRWSRGQFQSVSGPVFLRPVGDGVAVPPPAGAFASARATNNESRPVVVGFGSMFVPSPLGTQNVRRAFFWQPASSFNPSIGQTAARTLDSFGRGWSTDASRDLGQVGATLQNTFALDVSDPIRHPSDEVTLGKRIAVGIQGSFSNPDYYASTGRLTVQSGSRAVYWDLGSGTSANVSAPNYVYGMDARDSEARAVNSVGTIAGNYLSSPGRTRAYVSTYPYSSYETLEPYPGHDISFATDINDWGTRAGAIPGTTPGQVFGYSMNSSSGRYSAVVWKKDNGSWTATLLLPSGSPDSLIVSAGGRGVVTGLIGGVPHVFRDGRDPFSLSTATRSFSTLGLVTSYPFTSVRAINDYGDIVAGTSSGTSMLLRPTYYDLIELPLPPSSIPHIAEHSPRAVAMTVDGKYVVGYSRQCSLPGGPPGYPACGYLAGSSTIFDSESGFERALLWRIGVNGADVYVLPSNGSLRSRPTGVSPLGDIISGSIETAGALWTGSWGAGGANYSVDASSEYGAEFSTVSRSGDEMLAVFSPVDAGTAVSDLSETFELFPNGGLSGAVEVNYINAGRDAVGQVGLEPFLWRGVPPQAVRLGRPSSYTNPHVNGVGMPMPPSIMGCVGISSALCELRRKLIVGDAYRTSLSLGNNTAAMVWQSANLASPLDVSLPVGNVRRESKLNKVNGLAQAIGHAVVQMNFAQIDSSNAERPTMLSYDAFNRTSAINQMSAAMPPNTDFLSLAEGVDIDSSGGICGWGYKVGGTTGAFYLRPPSISDPACGHPTGSGGGGSGYAY